MGHATGPINAITNAALLFQSGNTLNIVFIPLISSLATQSQLALVPIKPSQTPYITCPVRLVLPQSPLINLCHLYHTKQQQ